MSEAAVREHVWETVQALNRAWAVDGDPERLVAWFHREMVAISPMDAAPLLGQATCVAAWKRFVTAFEVLRWHERDVDVRLHGDGRVAVVTYAYDITFRPRADAAAPREERGRDMMVLVEEDGRWQVVADQFSSVPQG